MKYFTLSELTRSETAVAMGIDNTPTAEVIAALGVLVERVLDPIRQSWGRPLTINSGYRSPALNRAIGGVPTSQHVKGEAADVTTGSVEQNRKLYDLILKMGIEFDQLIDEKKMTWIHISYKINGKNRREHFTL